MAGPLFVVEVEGVEELQKDLKVTLEDLLVAIASALFIEAEETMTDAKEITPVDEGPLRASGHVSLPERFADEIVVELGFGGPAGAGDHGGDTNAEDVGYAVFVHEDLTARHTVGQSKYLETPIRRRQASMSARLARRIRRRAGREV